jgi:hypothetical protein
VVVIQAILWWKETSLAAKAGVGESGRGLSSWGPWWKKSGAAVLSVVLVLVFGVVAMKSVGG